MPANQFLHSFPDSSQPASFDGANFSVYLNMNNHEKVDKFTLYDNLLNFHAIPKARFLQKVRDSFINPATGQWVHAIRNMWFYVVPHIRNNSEARDCARFLFRVHDQNNNPSNPTIVRPANKKAYLTNIAFQVFDGHEPFVHLFILPDGIKTPTKRIVPLDDNNNEINPGTIRKKDIFGNQNEVGVALFSYSSNSPTMDNEYFAIWKMFDENLHNYQNKNINTLTYEGIHTYTINTETDKSMYRWSIENGANSLRSSTAPRSSWYGGLIPDWIRNNFELTIIGKEGNNFVKILWDSKGRTQLSEFNKNSSYANYSDEPMNQMLNNLNLEIPSNIDNIEVQGIRPYYITQITDDTNDIKIASTTGAFTIVTFPIKIQIGVTYK